VNPDFVAELKVMRETMEFRISEGDACQYLERSQGITIGGDVRKVTVDTDDPLFNRILEINRAFHSRQDAFFLGWHAHRSYTPAEIDAADAFKPIFKHYFEPTGEECGTEYQDLVKCHHCGIGRTQMSDLRLDLRKAPKSKDVASTIADEIIVSQRFAEVLVDAKLTGFELWRVRHKARYEDDAVDLKELSVGHQILAKAEAEGAPHPTWNFWIWLNRPENRALMDQAQTEYSEKRRAKARRAGKPTPEWYQLVVTSAPVKIVPPTGIGKNPSDDDPEGAYRCPLGHVLGLNLISELSVSREDFHNRRTDVVQTRQGVGWLSRPTRLLVVSPRFRELVETEKIRGFKFEVAYLR
jgi:hypothetical protein